MVHVNTVDGTGDRPPQQFLECIVDVEDWFTPVYPQFLR